LNVDLNPKDEIDCLVKGMAFLMAHCEQEAYTWEGDKALYRPINTVGGMPYPFILANVGSGAGFIVVHREHSWERVSGTSIGGGTFYGLCQLLTGETSFDAMLDGAEEGCNERVDLTVGDIYGGDYSKFGLKAATIAASFGKAVTWPHQGGLAASGVGSAAGQQQQQGSSPSSAEAPNGEEDGSFRSVRRVGGTGSRARCASEKGLPSDSSSGSGSNSSSSSSSRRTTSGSRSSRETPGSTCFAVGAAVPSSHKAWDPASVMADAVAEAGGEGLDSEAPMGELAASPSRPRLPTIDGPLAGASGSSPSGAPSSSSSPSSAAAAAAQASWQPSDAYRALLIMISNNIGQLAYLNAVRYKCKRIYFAGNFLRTNNTVAMRTLAYAITFWSKGTLEGLFLRHEGYCGALGAFLSTLEQEVPS
jgi:hypothetical protein